MFQFPGFALNPLCIQELVPVSPHYKQPRGYYNRMSGGFPHSDISGSKPIPGSPKLNAGYHVLHRLLLPRHPPNALFALDLIRKEQGWFNLPPPVPPPLEGGHQKAVYLPVLRPEHPGGTVRPSG